VSEKLRLDTSSAHKTFGMGDLYRLHIVKLNVYFSSLDLSEVGKFVVKPVDNLLRLEGQRKAVGEENLKESKKAWDGDSA